MKNKEIRQAIQKGIDMKNIRSATNGEPALDFPISEKQLTLDKWPELPKQDTAGATKTIAEFKKAHPDFGSINIVTISSYDLPDIANKLSEELKKLGIENTVSIFEPNQDFTLNILSQRSYDILIYEIGLGVDPDVFPYYHSSQTTGTGLNFSNYKNAIVNDLILSARNTIDADLRKKKYENFLNYFVSDVPAIGITQSNLTYFVNNNVRTFSSENSLASEDDRFADVHLWSSIKTVKNRTP
jgi:peptide/nickel transport system substrate-binding protein